MATANTDTINQNNDGSNSNSPGNDEEGNNEAERAFECNICLDVARDAVISMCGHLFCWPCIHQWMETRPNRQICPVCKAGISRDKVIPLYGRGNPDGKDPRDKVPPRPQGQRSEPTSSNPFSGFGFGGGQGGGGGGFHMSFGIGAFPFGFFATNFNFGEERPGAPASGSHQALEEAFLHKVFLWVAFAFIMWLLIA